jgi:hypothetical protein
VAVLYVERFDHCTTSIEDEKLKVKMILKEVMEIRKLPIVCHNQKSVIGTRRQMKVGNWKFVTQWVIDIGGHL